MQETSLFRSAPLAMTKRFWRQLVSLGVASTLALSCTEPAGPDAEPALTTLSVALSASSVQVGQQSTATATGADQNGAPIATGAVTWTSTPQATVSADGIVTAVSAGQATITATAGEKTAQATLTITALPATALALATPLSNTAVNRELLVQQPVIQLVNANGGTVAASGVVVTATVSSGSLIGSATATTGSNGMAVFTGLSLAGATGNRTLTFSANGLTPATAVVTLGVGAPSSVAVKAGNQQTADAGALVAVAPSVLVTDADANPVPNVSVAFDVTSGSGTVTGSPATTNSAGVATVTGWRLGAPGLNSLQAHVVNGATGVAFTALATQAPAITSVSVSVVPTTIQVGQTAQATASAIDQYGASIATGPVTWTVNSGTATVTANGVVTGASAGQAVVTATAGGKSGQAVVTVLATPVLTALTVSIAPFAIQVGQTAQASVVGTDQFGAPIAVGAVIWSSSSGAASVSATGVVIGLTAGSATITATSAGKSAQAQITISAAPVVPVLTSLQLTLASSSIQVGATTQASVVGFDQFGSPIAVGPVTWSATGSATVNQSGLVSGTSAGNGTIFASVGSIGAQAGITVTSVTPPGGLVLASMSMAIPNGGTIPVGGSVQVSVAGRDQNGSPIATGPLVWTVTGPATVSSSGLVTGVSPGTATITATASNGVYIYGDVIVTGTTPPTTPTLTSIVVTFSHNVIVGGQQTQATAQGLDQFGNPIATGPITWSLPNGGNSFAIISSTGLVTTNQGVGGLRLVRATAGNVSGEATFTVRWAASVTLTLSKTRVLIGESLDATVTVLDQFGSPLDILMSFTVSCPGFCNGNATITRTSNTTATLTATREGFVAILVQTPFGPGGTYYFDRKGFDVVKPPELSGVVVTWPTSLAVGQTVNIPVSGKDQFGNPFPLGAVAYYADPTYVATITQFGDLTVHRPGSVTVSIAASKPGSPDFVVSKLFTVPGTPTARLEVTAFPPAPLINRQQFPNNSPIRVQIVDIASAQPVGWQFLSVSAALSSGGGTLTGSLVGPTNLGGFIDFNDFTVSGPAGPKVITFSAPGVNPVTWSFATVAAGASAIVINAGNNQTAVFGNPVPVAPRVQVTDPDGNGVAGVAVNFTVMSGGGSVTGASTTTDANGSAQVGSWTLGSVGANTLRAQAAGVGSTVTFTATATASIGAVRR